MDAHPLQASALDTCVSIAASADAMLSEPPANKNYGTHPLLRVGGKDRSLVRFDLSSIPAGANVESATLRLTARGSGSASGVGVHRATAAWAENTVSAASFGNSFDPAVAGTIAVGSPNATAELEVTGLVSQWVAGTRPNNGFLLESSASQKTIFSSREGGGATEQPSLELCYTVPEPQSEPVIDQSQTTLRGENNLNVDIRYAQTFVVGITGKLTGVDLWIAWMGVDPDATVTITRVLDDGRPDESNSLGSATLGGPGMIGSSPPTHFDLTGSNIAVHAGDKLAIVVTSTDTPQITGDVAVLVWGQSDGTSDAPYIGGQAWSTWNGFMGVFCPEWCAPRPTDIYFRTWVAPAP